MSCWSLQYIKHKQVFWQYAILGCTLDCRVWSFVKPYPITPHEQCSTFWWDIILCAIYTFSTYFTLLHQKNMLPMFWTGLTEKKKSALSSELQRKLRPTSFLPFGISPVLPSSRERRVNISIVLLWWFFVFIPIS